MDLYPQIYKELLQFNKASNSIKKDLRQRFKQTLHKKDI